MKRNCAYCGREIPEGARCWTGRDRYGDEYHVCGRCVGLRKAAAVFMAAAVVYTVISVCCL